MNRAVLPGLALAVSVFASLASADERGAPDPSSTVRSGAIEISGAFARATLPGAPVGGGYFTVTNAGDTDDRLLEVLSDAARTVEIHEMALVGDVMTMQSLPEGIVIPAGETLAFAPGSYHLMFMDLERPFAEGESVAVTLVFQAAGEIAVTLAVEPMGARAPSGSAAGAHHHH